MRKRMITQILVGLVLAALLPALASAVEPSEGKIRVLLITGGHGFDQEPFFEVFASFPDIDTKHVPYPDAAKLLGPDLAKTCDVVVFYDMWNKGFTDEQKAAFVQLLEKGIGVVAMHHTLAAHGNWPEYQSIIGGRYHTRERVVDGKKLPKSTFSHGETLSVTIADTEHPITRGMKDFAIHDETYFNYDTDPRARVLLTTDHPKNDPELAWVREYGRSRVFYLMLGHDHDAYENPNFRLLVARGIRWAAKRATEPES
ncbi:MAG: ThuA domain-containing protein [Pirellulaceae bacterium]